MNVTEYPAKPQFGRVHCGEYDNLWLEWQELPPSVSGHVCDDRKCWMPDLLSTFSDDHERKALFCPGCYYTLCINCHEMDCFAWHQGLKQEDSDKRADEWLEKGFLAPVEFELFAEELDETPLAVVKKAVVAAEPALGSIGTGRRSQRGDIVLVDSYMFGDMSSNKDTESD